MLKMLKQTYYLGKAYNVGEKCNVDSITEKRWIKNGIAEEMPSMDFPSMSDEELSDYAEVRGVDIARCRTRDGIITKLEKSLQLEDGDAE